MTDHPIGTLLLGAVSAIEDGFFVLDRDWRYVYINPAGCDLIGHELEEVRGRSHWEVTPQLLGTFFESEYRRAMADQTTVRFEALFEPLGAWFKIHAYPSAGHLAVIARDVTAAKHARDALLESEARHRAILHAVPDLILWIDRDGWIQCTETNGNHPLCHSCAITEKDGIRKCHIRDMFAEVVAKQVGATLSRALRTGTPEQLDFQMRTKDRETLQFEARIVPADPQAVVMVVQDTTERRRLEREVLRISEDVHEEIGRDLHDGLASHLTGVAMLARSLARDVRRGIPAEADAIDELAALVGEANEQARALARGLNPVAIERDGLQVALASLTRSMEFTVGPRVSLAATPIAIGTADAGTPYPGAFPRLELHTATHLYRIAQEACHNAVRHAEASSVEVKLDMCAGRIRLSVSDDGLGFDHDATRGMGINVMHYRARLIGGSLEIRRQPNGGTVVACELPMISDEAR